MPDENVAIESVAPASAEAWDRAWRGCDYATYFHSREWAELWRDVSRGATRPDPLLVRFGDGTSAVLPLSRRRVARGLAAVIESSPAGTFGGWVSTDRLEERHARALASVLLARGAGVTWRINPYDPNAGTVRPPGAEQDTTHAVALDRDFEAIVHTWSKGHRAAVKQAQREGVTVRAADSLDDWRGYYGAYMSSVERWGDAASTVYPWELFERLHGLASADVRLWVGLCEGAVVAGTLCFYARRHVVYWHGAALAEFFERRPVNLLVYTAMRDARERGLRWFDFNPSGGLEGVRHFKKSFGADELACPVVRREGRLLRALRVLGRARRGGRAAT